MLRTIGPGRVSLQGRAIAGVWLGQFAVPYINVDVAAVGGVVKHEGVGADGGRQESEEGE